MSNQLQISGAAKIRSIQGPVVANSGVITALDGDASQYVRGDGTLADFPTSTGGGSSVSYYLNTSVSQGTIGGVAYKQLSKVPISGAGTDVTISANGYIASYITDANDPALLEVPAGNFNCEFYFSVNSNSHNPYVYAELYKYDGSTFTLLGSNQAIPEYLTNGTTLSAYYFAIPVATSVLTITDRIAIRIYVNVDGRTVTLHTENNHLCQVVTTFSKGLTTLNSLTRQVQFFQTGTSGSDFAISSSVATHTFNLPVASAANTGKLSSTDWSTFNGKVPYTGANANVDLGIYNLTAAGVTANSFNAIGSGVQGGYLYLKKGSSPFNVLVGSNSITAEDSKFILMSDAGSSNYKLANIDIGLLTNNTARTYTLPDASGTLALTSDLSSYVPYTGATANVDLGLFSLKANGILAYGNGTAGGIVSFTQTGTLAGVATGAASIGSVSAGKLNIYFGDAGLEAAILDNSLLTADRTYNLPDASGTLALTSNLSSYVPYTGATANVDLGLNNLTANNVFGETSLNVKVLPSGSVFSTGYSVLSSLAGKFTMAQEATVGNLKAFTFDFSAWASNSSYTYTLPAASGTIAILEASIQVFSGTVQILGQFNTKYGISIEKGSTPSSFSFADVFIYAASGAANILKIANNTYTSTLNFPTSNQTFTYPAATGTLALLESNQTFTGLNTFSSVANMSATLQVQQGLFLNQAIQANTGSPYTAISGRANGLFICPNSGTGYDLIFPSTSSYSYTFPAANGTITLGTGTTNYVSKFTGTNTIGNSLIFDNGTNVGINSSTFTFAATGRTNLVLNGTTDSLFEFQNNAINSAYLFSTATGFEINATGSRAIQFNTNSAERMRITSAGNVGIGTSSPSYLLTVSNTSFSGGANGLLTLIGGSESSIMFMTTSYGADTNKLLIDNATGSMQFRVNSAERMRIATSGLLTLTRTTFSSIQAVGCYDDTSAGARSLSITSSGSIVSVPSSLRYKKDVETLDSNISESIYKMRPIWYRSISNHDRDDWSWYGLIAEEIAEIEPRLVQWGYKREDYIINEETKEQELKEGAELQADGVDYARITVLLVAEMQKMNQIIQDLQSRLDNAGL